MLKVILAPPEKSNNIEKRWKLGTVEVIIRGQLFSVHVLSHYLWPIIFGRFFIVEFWGITREWVVGLEPSLVHFNAPSSGLSNSK